jgi:hypothetical protein
MDLLLLGEQSGIFQERAAYMFKMADEAPTERARRVFLSMALGYDQMALTAQSREKSSLN